MQQTLISQARQTAEDAIGVPPLFPRRTSAFPDLADYGRQDDMPQMPPGFGYGVLLVGTICGFAAFVVALLSGVPFPLALLSYTGAGTGAALFVTAAAALRIYRPY